MFKPKTTLEEFEKWLQNPEGLNLEYKTAKNSFSKDKDLPDYCAALANEGGGKLILGVNNNQEVVGTNAFHGTHNELSIELLNKICIRVDVEEMQHPKGRVLIFHIPSHLRGQIVKSTGKYKYPMRAGESLVEMDTTRLKQILTETEIDFSKKIVSGLSISDLDKIAIDNFKSFWVKKSNRNEYLNFTNEKTLQSIGLLTNDGLNYASLIFFGKKERISSILPCCEIIFEWRQDSKKISHDYRISWCEPFFKIYDDIWNTINARNIRYPFQEGFFQREIFAFNEKSIREALLNAVAHRDYSISGRSVIIKASPEEFFIESPGGFPPGINSQNILNKTYWRNRAIAETFEKAGLVERSGQGMDDIFTNSINEGKGMPDFIGSDEYSVCLHIPVQVKDKNFIIFLEKISREKQITFSFEERFELEQIRQQRIVTHLKFKDKLLGLGIIEKIDGTKGAKYILSRQYYTYSEKLGIHTRLTGILREQKKGLILSHIRRNGKGYIRNLIDTLNIERKDVNNLLVELKKVGKIDFIGSKKSGHWILKDIN